ncbi:hypothetical protein SNE510_67800 [Streptomyces sp. NE5-10]|uniref:hypothetical protein n=1 Tax=Streptomyces sp. NE5-10 TaxID=2759674 RepID=UPI001A63F3AC|nr:hypothetical protein [Streptomyces sp. NE5-10]GHJ97261.1 hypothetical protein SNE510_67800 [Streptomyces sp. NE5-10]
MGNDTSKKIIAFGAGGRVGRAAVAEAAARVGRLLTLGIATTPEDAAGARPMDAPDLPAAWRAFAQGHVVEFELLAAGPDRTSTG